jgi:hypothetical protein
MKNFFFTVKRLVLLFNLLSSCYHVSLFIVYLFITISQVCNPGLLGVALLLSSYGTARLSPAHVPSPRDEMDRDPCEPVKLSSTGARNKKTIQRRRKIIVFL